MAKTILQTVTFKNTSPETLYTIYMDSKKHSKATGGVAKVSTKIGSPYSAWDGYISGKTLQLMKGKMIIQSWRSTEFKSKDLDSTLILQFEKKGNETLIHLVHANVPDHQYEGVKAGWNDFYWKPWKKYLGSSRP